MSSDEATFRISIDGNASVASKDIAASARQASNAITKYEAEVKALGADLRRLKGNSEEVVATKAALKKRVDEAKQSISKLTVELAKQGTSYAAASAAAKKYGDGTSKLGAIKDVASKAIGALGSALSPAASKIGKSLEPATKKLGEAIAPVSKKIGAALGPASKKLGEAITPIAKKVGTALAPAGRAVAKFGSGASRALSAVSSKVTPLVEETLPKLGSALGAVAASAAALAIGAIVAVAAGAVAGTVALIAFGLAASDAAAKINRQRQAILGNASDAKAFGEQVNALAKKVPQGVDELNALSVSLSKSRLTGKAMVDTMAAVAQTTGAVDAEAGTKIQELLTRGQNSGRFYLGRLELQGTGIDFDDVAKEYAAGTKKSVEAAKRELQMGQVPIEKAAEALKNVTEKKFGDINIKNAFSLENAPKKFMDQFKYLASGLDLGPISKGLSDAFGQLSPEAPLGRAVKSFFDGVGTDFVKIAAESIPVLLEGFKYLVVGALKVATYFYEMKKQVIDAFNTDGYVGAGQAIVTGLVKGILGSNHFLFDAIKSLGRTTKEAFADELKIHSPSKVFDKYGENTVEGYAQGVDRASSRASGAVANMVQAPAPSMIGGGGSSNEEVHVHFHGDASPNTQASPSPEFLASLTRAIRDARTSVGV